MIHNSVKFGSYTLINVKPVSNASMFRQYDDNFKDTIIGKNTRLCNGVIVYSNVEIGEECLLGDHVSILVDVKIGNNVLLGRNVTVNSDVEIGNNNRIMDNCHITGHSKIGNNCFLGVGIVSCNDNLFGKNGSNDSNIKGCIIQDNVSIGSGAILMPGITIGEGSIIAAGTLVNSNVPNNTLVSGNPMKIICRVPQYMKRNTK